MALDQDFRTPLSRVRGLGSAREGTEHFTRQRLTAIANLVLVPAFVWVIVATNGQGWAQTVAYLANPFITIVLLLVVGSALFHMKLGMQVIIEDYVHGAAGKALLVANIFFCVALAAACVYAIVKLGFGTPVPVVPISLPAS